MIKKATIDPSGKYRYTLERVWDEENLFRVLFILLNPSTANAEQDDATVRKCVGFAQRWGAGGLEIVNLFALRATDPTDLSKAVDPIGPENDERLRLTIERTWCGKRVAAWGNHGSLNGRSAQVQKMLVGRGVECFGKTKSGEPLHVLYQPYERILVPLWDERLDYILETEGATEAHL